MAPDKGLQFSPARIQNRLRRHKLRGGFLSLLIPEP